jgi:hypothetical protein
MHLARDPAILFQRKIKKINSGAERDRTADPHVANVVLSQLSYCPVKRNPKIFKPTRKVKR